MIITPDTVQVPLGGQVPFTVTPANPNTASACIWTVTGTNQNHTHGTNATVVSTGQFTAMYTGATYPNTDTITATNNEGSCQALSQVIGPSGG